MEGSFLDNCGTMSFFGESEWDMAFCSLSCQTTKVRETPLHGKSAGQGILFEGAQSRSPALGRGRRVLEPYAWFGGGHNTHLVIGLAVLEVVGSPCWLLCVPLSCRLEL